MALQLDPAIPLVWRDPHTMQLGVDDVIAILGNLSPAQERMLAALQVGIGDDGIRALLELAGATTREWNELLTATTRALARSKPNPRLGALTIDGTHAAGSAIAHLLRQRGHDIVDRDTAEFAVIVADYTVPPHRHARWLRRDIPHIAVVFSDRESRIGPFVEPGEGPCLLCFDLAATDDDPAWPALAAQLTAHTAPVDEFAINETAVRAARVIARRIEFGNRSLAGTAMYSDQITGATRTMPVQAHPHCACGGLPENVTALPGPCVDQRESSSTRVAASRE